MEWKVGPVEGRNGSDLASALTSSFTEKYGGTEGELGAKLRQQFEGISGCLDHQLGAFEGAQGLQAEIHGFCTTAPDASQAPSIDLRITQLFREPTGRFDREGDAAREHATSGAGGSG